MSKSKTKKMREHKVRQGQRDPGLSRLTFGVFDGVTKRPPVPSVVAERKQNKHKKKGFDYDKDSGAFYNVI
ncbi:hypothetical protein D3C81_198840 [compost metagenome]